MIEILIPEIKNKVNCKFCGALIGYEKDDIATEQRFFNAGCSFFKKYIICPQCKNEIILEAQK